MVKTKQAKSKRGGGDQIKKRWGGIKSNLTSFEATQKYKLAHTIAMQYTETGTYTPVSIVSFTNKSRDRGITILNDEMEIMTNEETNQTKTLSRHCLIAQRLDCPHLNNPRHEHCNLFHRPP